MLLIELPKHILLLRNNVAKFLKGMATHVLESPFNAFVDGAGRIIATCEQKQVGADACLLVVAAGVSAELIAHIEKYGRLSKTHVEKQESYVYADLDSTLPVPEGCEHLPALAGTILVSPKPLPLTVSEEQFCWFRLQHNYPLHTLDYQREMLLNVDTQERYVSFTKGCFLGQEVLARVHYKSKPPKRLVVVKAADCLQEQRAAITSLAKDPASGEAYGFLFVKNE